jgi:serine phosphatase RsbU (regulator of sigma subunit)
VSGGDFVVVVPLPDGRIGVGVGDVAGHGGAASEAMRSLHGAMRRAAATGAGPAEVLTTLDAEVCALDVDGMATAAYAVVDPASGTLVHASAGHLPLVCLSRDGARLMEGPVGLPLGVGAGFGAAADGVAAAYEEEVVAVPAGSTVLAYTDGLVERRGHDIDAGLAELLEVAAGVAGHALAEQVDAVFGALATGSRDDVTVLGLRLPAAPARSLPTADRRRPTGRVRAVRI